MKHARRIRRTFRYTPACATDIRRTFERILREQREQRLANDKQPREQKTA